MNAQFFPVRLDAQGVFYCQTDSLKREFFDVEGKPLTRDSTPGGSWPVCLLIEESGAYLYFTYFLSSTLHKWRLTQTGRREVGHDAKPEELDAFWAAAQDDADLAWLAAKFSPAGLQLRDNPPTQEFAALEHAAACALAEGRVKDMVLAEPAGASPGSGLLHRLRVPAGYRGAVALSSGERKVTGDIWGDLQSDGFDLDLNFGVDLSQRLFADLSRKLLSALIRLRVEIDRDLTIPQCCVVRADRGADTDGGVARTLKLGVSAALSANNGAVLRLRHSLDVLLPHLLRFLDEAEPGFALRFCFSDAGADGFISFDRPVSSSRPLAPDLYMLNDAASAALTLHDEAGFRRAFHAKQPTLFWRGASTGSRIANLADLAANPRVRACGTIQEQLGGLADCKISRLVQLTMDMETADGFLRDAGIKGEEVDESAFALRQFYIDLPGNAASWGTFRKFLCGCVVLRPLPGRRELAYYRILEPGRHYAVVQDDYSDVGEVVRKLLADPEGAAAIAYRGRKAVIEFMRKLPETMLDVFRGAVA